MKTELPEGSSSPNVRLLLPTLADQARIWRPRRLRLFVTHASRVPTSGAPFKTALASYGIDAFVAHEEVEPSPEWLREIELALRTTHALCAIVTNDFHASQWCNQEVGFALGRPVPVFRIGSAADAPGFLHQLHAIQSDDSEDVVAQRVFELLTNLQSCKSLLIEALLCALEEADSPVAARQFMERLKALRNQLSPEQIRRIAVAARNHPPGDTNPRGL